ncbi:hypothetical protein CK203_083600 [Vitis vinifera]|uniref:Uncharacterized protein n=1 Tax=Vitis vinifera TaxID=29760 RepID=A0A438BS84_VITVI|nr:hypothetical protein CK203_083600 [Vitis vinifera]
MDLHYAYHQGLGHDTNRCSALRHAIQDLIDQDLVNLGQPSVTTNPLPAHATHSMSPLLVVVPPVTRLFSGTDSREEVRKEDNEILRQLQSTQAQISIWSLLATSSTHRDALIRALIACSGHRVLSFLLDNGSSLNVCPLATPVASALHLQILVPPYRQ